MFWVQIYCYEWARCNQAVCKVSIFTFLLLFHLGSGLKETAAVELKYKKQA